MNAKRGSSVASSLDHLFATKVIKITDISSPTRHSFMQMLPTSAFRRYWSGASMTGKEATSWEALPSQDFLRHGQM